MGRNNGIAQTRSCAAWKAASEGWRTRTDQGLAQLPRAVRASAATAILGWAC